MATLLDPEQAPAQALAETYLQRWEIEGSFAECKTHLRERRVVLRSKTPDLVKQEFWGLLLAHSLVRTLMHSAAGEGGKDADEVSFTLAVNVIRRKLVAGKSLPFFPSAKS